MWFYHAILSICLASVCLYLTFLSLHRAITVLFVLHGSDKFPYHARFYQNTILIFLTFFSKNIFIWIKWKCINSKFWCHDQTLCGAERIHINMKQCFTTFDLFSLMHFSFRLDLIHKDLIESMEEELNILFPNHPTPSVKFLFLLFLFLLLFCLFFFKGSVSAFWYFL